MSSSIRRFSLHGDYGGGKHSFAGEYDDDRYVHEEDYTEDKVRREEYIPHGGHSRATERRWAHYLDAPNLSNEWRPRVIKQAAQENDSPTGNQYQVCRVCTSLLWSEGFKKSAVADSTACILCQTISSAGQRNNVHRMDTLYAQRVASEIVLKSEEHSANIPVIRLYPCENSSRIKEFKGFFDDLNSDSFSTVKAWLKHCDKSHWCREHQKYDIKGERDPTRRRLPTRLLNVSPSKDPTDLRLDTNVKLKPVKSDDLSYYFETAVKPKSEDYIALSHCWGQASEASWRTMRRHVKPHVENLLSGDLLGSLKATKHVIRELGGIRDSLSTFRKEPEDRTVMFSLSELPQTLRDAVEVTRKLGVKYLWIDSLCIVQDSAYDWQAESKQMEDVYALAYCTIAATAAPDSLSGFLEDGVKPRGESARGFYVKGSSGQTLYVSTNFADFDKDVQQATLNSRAWVTQERFLSPRTIHFSGSQIYMECEEGILAGDDIFLECDKGSIKYFELDARFPRRLDKSGFGAIVEFLQSLIENYSSRGMTKPTDRPIAIASLMHRIETTLPCSINHGILAWYQHRSLLWRTGGQRTSRIHYQHQMPSWSWMAYEGCITFIHNDYGWGDLYVNNGLEISGNVLKATVLNFSFSGVKVRQSNGHADAQLLDSNGSKKGWMAPDTDNVELSCITDLIIIARVGENGKESSQRLVLFVQRLESGEYERCGAGMIHQGCKVRSVGQGCII